MTLYLILGDQLDRQSSIFAEIDPQSDTILMAEVAEESTHVWSHKARTALFLSAMRHFRDDLAETYTLRYVELDDPDNTGSLAGEFRRAITDLRPERARMVQPGDWRALESLREVADSHDLPLEILPDHHFYWDIEQFREWAAGRKALRLAYFYRALRKEFEVLLDANGKPEGGDWNYDSENRGAFNKDGPGMLPEPERFPPSKTTRQVLKLVQERFESHPGSLENFDWPVTPDQARAALDDFIENRLPMFGEVQDAMWTGEPYLYHSRISAALNLKLLNPREAVDAAEAAYRSGHAPLAAVEGFIRQILGWREYVRGIYWTQMPDYADGNALGATRDLPPMYWTGETDMRCMREVIGQTLEYGYAHHIQRLMVTGLFSLLWGVEPRQIHEWYLAVYVDAVEWVELPNVIGMSQFADGGLMASKPYAATGKYIQRMSDYCANCPHNPAKATGERACPFTTLYWDFLDRHRERLSQNPRMKLQVRNVERKSESDLAAIREQAREVYRRYGKL